MEKELVKVAPGRIGGATVQTVNGRDLHAFLEVGKDFSNWMKNRIASFDFMENCDFVVLAESGGNPLGGRPAKEYAITLDMAKELSMVERNDKGKQARRYFIECERRAMAAAAPALPNPDRTLAAALGGMCKSVIRKEAEATIKAVIANAERGLKADRMIWKKIDALERAVGALAPAAITQLVDAELARRTAAIRNGRTAAQVWREFRLRPLKGAPVWLGNRLAEMGAAVDRDGLGELGATARLFDPDKAAACMRNGLRSRAERYVAEHGGAGGLHVVGAETSPL